MEFPAAPDELGVLARRIEFVERLREEPLHKADLVEEFDTSRSTVNRAISELEEAGFAERITRGYVTTQAGRLAAERYRAFLDDQRAVLEARPVLATLPHDAEIPARVLREATTGSPGDAYALFELVAEQLGTASEYRAVLPRVVDSRHLRACHAQVVRGELTATLACPADEFERLGEEFPHLTGELLDDPSFTAKASSSPQFGLMCFREDPDASRPDSVVLLGYDGSDIAGFVHTETSAAVEWATRMLDSTIDDARDVTAVIDRWDAPAALTSLGGDRFPASLRSEGFVRIGERYFRRREPMAPLAGWRAGLGLPEVAAGYAVPRTPGGDGNTNDESDDESTNDESDDESTNDESFAGRLLARLRADEDLALVGPPGAGKSTVCKRVACAWHERGHGPVFYRESGRGQPFDSVGALERTVERALERGDGELLVVVEDAVRAEANAIFELVDAFRGSDEVAFLLDSRESEWHDPDEFPVDARLRAVRRDALEVVGIPPLTETDCRHILDRFGAEAGERPDLQAEEVLSEVRRGRTDDDGSKNVGAAPGEITLLLHRLVRYADSLSPSVEDEPPTGLDEDVDRVREDLAALGETALGVGVLVNVLNAAGLGVYPAAVYALVGEGLERHGTVRTALERLEGHLLFPPATETAAERATSRPYRVVHEMWSVRFLERLLETEGETAAGRRFGRCVAALLALADEPARREAVAREVGGDSQLLESVVAAPETWADETVEAVFGLGRTYPKLAPLFGTPEESTIQLPETCSEAVAARRPEWRGWMYERAGAFDRAEREFERLAQIAREGGTEERERLLMESLLGRSDVARKQGNLEEAAVYARECLDLATDTRDSKRRADASRRLGEIAWRRGDYEQAREFHERSLELERDLGDRRGEAETLKDLGTVAHQQGEYGTAREYFRESLDIERDLGDRLGEANTLNNLGTVAHQQGTYETAHEYFQRSLAIKRDLGDRLGEANTLNNLGVIAETQGDYERAREYHERSLEIARDLGDRRGETYSLQNLGKVAAHRGAYGQAHEYHEQALEIARDLDDSHGEAHSVIQLGTIALRKGDHDRAREHLETGLELVCELGIRNERRRALWALAVLAREESAYEQAESHLEAARNPDPDDRDPLMDAQIQLERARLALARGDLDAARRRGRDAREAFEEIGAAHWIGRARRLLGRVAAASGSAEPEAAVDEGEAALVHWHAALETFETVGAPQDVLTTLDHLVTYWRELGEDDETREWCRRAQEVLAEAPEPVAIEHEEWVGEVGEALF